jgi:hypothetical protein
MKEEKHISGNEDMLAPYTVSSCSESEEQSKEIDLVCR